MGKNDTRKDGFSNTNRKHFTRLATIAIAAALGLSLASCSITPEVSNPVERTASWYKDTAVSTVRSNLKDPESMRLYNVSEPFVVDAALKGKTGVCVTLNATNGYGGYVGAKTFLVSFIGGNLRNWGGIGPTADITPSANVICPR